MNKRESLTKFIVNGIDPNLKMHVRRTRAAFLFRANERARVTRVAQTSSRISSEQVQGGSCTVNYSRACP